MAGLRTLLVFPKAGPSAGTPIVTPLRCKSFRCPRCWWIVAREDARRIEAGATSRPDWVYAVLTLDPRNHRGPRSAYADAGELWRKRLLRRLERRYGERIEYVQTWEQHATGWPHVNVLLRSDKLLADVREHGIEEREASGPKGARVALFTPWRTRVFKPLVVDSGFGRIVWAEPVVCARSLAHYFAKIVGEFCRSHDKPGDQRPITAPFGTRRLRSSTVPQLLPPRRRSSGEWGGVAVDAPLAAFVDALGTIGATWGDVEHAQRLAAAKRECGERLAERMRVAAERWGAVHGAEIIPRRGDDGWSPSSLLVSDAMERDAAPTARAWDPSSTAFD